MLINLLFAETFHFSISVLAAFVFFAAGLLYFDSWQIDKHKKTPLFRGIGFFFLSIVYAFHASAVEQQLAVSIFQIMEVAGLSLIFASLVIEPILHPPSSGNAGLRGTSPPSKTEKLTAFAPFGLPVFSWIFVPLSAILLFLISAAYFRKTTTGYEKQLKPAFFAKNNNPFGKNRSSFFQIVFVIV